MIKTHFSQMNGSQIKVESLKFFIVFLVVKTLSLMPFYRVLKNMNVRLKR